MSQIDGSGEIIRRSPHPADPDDLLVAENNSLRLLLSQAKIDAWDLYSQALIDAKGRETADQLQKLILEELHHRIKNMLATVIAITSQSLRGVKDAEHARLAIEGRLIALGKAHDLLLQERWASADLGQIVRGAIKAFDDPGTSTIAVTGPDVRLAAGEVIAIAMTINELCTNTTKYGALSVPGGRVDIVWSLDPATRRLHLSWTERDGPPVQFPERRGFGTRLIETLGRQLNGTVEVRYDPAGFAYELDVPLASQAGSTLV
ncbi:signal transduction histidine kinase [Rhodopseudomonas palustris BisB5]|uniref:histidine kinase n=1 Tax=Rhodopseudomonas palustris (strain BisB5) TaxID=316057 RepID=Q134K1_RHOPS|nr:signal transduction histidine kinase [Rhodopseudomonas palustris BisB5]